MAEANRSELTTDTGAFAIVPEWVLVAEVSDRAVRLYAILARHADAKEGTAFPARRTLARRLGCSVDTVDRAVKELIELGALVREHRYEEHDGERRQTSNLWTVARVQYPGRTHAAPGEGTDAAPPSRTGAAPGTRATSELEPGELEPSAATAAVEPAVAAYDPLKGTKIDGHNLPFDALVEATRADPRTEGGRLGQALKIIRRVVVEDSSPQTFLDPETGEWHIARQIGARAALYRRRWPNVELTPTALASNWSRVVTAQPGSDPLATLDAAQRGIDEARRTA